MAYKDSDEIKANESYALGEYSFRIERSSVPGSTNDKIEAICTDKDGHNARKSIQVQSSAKLSGWYVEANETTADVYVTVTKKGENPFNLPAFSFLTGFTGDIVTTPSHYHIPVINASLVRRNAGSVLDASLTRTYQSSFTYNGKTVYVGSWRGMDVGETGVSPPIQPQIASYPEEQIAWTMFYGDPSGEDVKTETILIGRFAIEIEDAGGDGPGSDWIDPGDYDPDWEEGDPTHTLYVTVTGALSGRHNDPIEDPSYSYIPADKDTVKGYGCGGDGGHGGGGGAGASTVVVHKFATNQANSKEVTAIARRHGYGSGGGKGGKGGDGCILVYY